VPPSMLAADLMARMQAQRIQMALVIDEYGGTDGLVSLEDIVEMVVGDIEDEHDDEEETLITEQPTGTSLPTPCRSRGSGR
jgi:CBS domain containing-hemolysin-like protein